jgi:hypothetical protein
MIVIILSIDIKLIPLEFSNCIKAMDKIINGKKDNINKPTKITKE